MSGPEIPMVDPDSEIVSVAYGASQQKGAYTPRERMAFALRAALPAIHADLRERLLGDEALQVHLAVLGDTRRPFGPYPERCREALIAALDSIGLGEEEQ